MELVLLVVGRNMIAQVEQSNVSSMKKTINTIIWWCTFAPLTLILCTIIIMIALPYIIVDVIYEKWLAWKNYEPVNLSIFKEGSISKRKKG